MIALLERFYDPTSGVIAVRSPPLHQALPITGLDPRKYRAAIGLVSQEPVLYSGTIRENIALGLSRPLQEHDVTVPEKSNVRMAANNEEIEDVSRRVNIFDFITSLP